MGEKLYPFLSSLFANDNKFHSFNLEHVYNYVHYMHVHMLNCYLVVSCFISN